MLAEAHHVKPLKIPKDIPKWLDRATRALVGDIISLLSERHPDLLAVFDTDDSLLDVHQGDSLSHTLGLAYMRHLDAPREVKVMFASRTLQEWDPTFIANVMRDGILLYTCGSLPAPFAA